MKQKIKNTIFYVFICCIGVAIEYFDFIIFALLAPYIGKNFFPENDPTAQLLKTFMIFSLGYLSRPIGGIVLGSLSDKCGRKKILVSSIMIMALSTLTIGIIPSYQNIGILSTCILVLCRVMQGIAHGTEKPLAITYISELNFKRKSFHCSILYTSASFGSICSLTFCYFLEYGLSDQQIVSWGWRLPFITGGVLAILGVIFRLYAIESPVFDKIKIYKNTNITKQLFSNVTNIYIGFIITLVVSILVIMGLFFPSFIHNYLGISHDDAFKLSLIGMIYYTLILPILGYIYSNGSKVKYFTWTCLIIFISAYHISHLLILNTYYSLLVYIIILKTLLASLGASYPMMLTELFSSSYRNTGVAISYSLAFSIGSLLPAFFLRFINDITNDLYILVATFMIVSGLALLAILYEKNNIKRLS